MAKKEKQDSLLAAVMSGFKAAGIDTDGSVTTITEYYRDTKYMKKSMPQVLW